MNLYGLNSTLFDLGFSDSNLLESISSSDLMFTDRRYTEREEENLLKLSNSILTNIRRNSSPPKQRHDGTSPLPLGMDWSPPPRSWDGMNAIWPQDFHSGWSYCVIVPSWSIFSESRGSEPVVFYRVQTGLQSPEGVTTTHGVLRRFSDFLKLSTDLKQAFRNKKLPPFPPKGLLRLKNRKLLEERRCSLEDWMAKILLDIEFSRSAPVACFLELEAAARSAFRESSHHLSNVNLSCNSSSSSEPFSSQNDVFTVTGTSALTSNYSLTEVATKEVSSGNDGSSLSKEFSEGKEEKYLQKSFDKRINLGQIHTGSSYTPRDHYDSVENPPDLKTSPMISHAKDLSKESLPKGTSSVTPNEITSWEAHQDGDTSPEFSVSVETSEALDMMASSELQIIPPLNEQQKANRLLTTLQRLVISNTDIEDLIARLNQELSVEDLETEFESTKQIDKENLEQAISIGREKFIKMQWVLKELRRKCMEMEFRLKVEQDEKAHAETTKSSIIKENETLRQELDSAREQLKNLQKCQEVGDLNSKSDVKLLVREVKSLGSSQSELQQELHGVSKERMEFETRLQKERTDRECINAANRKLLRQCEILCGRLEECSVNFLVEKENKLRMEFPPDALDILDTSENHISLLMAEAQLISQDVATTVTSSSFESDNLMTMDDELRKLLSDVLIDNTILRKQANSVIRCALNMTDASPNGSQAIKEAP